MVRIRRLLNNRMAQNAAALYLVQIFGYALPLITLPYLTRVLHQDDYGSMVFGQSFALWLSVVGEYGFAYSATRAIARMRDNRDGVSALVASVIGAKLLLVAGMVLGTWLTTVYVPAFREQPLLAWWALAVAVAAALDPLWYFQAIERIWLVALLEALARLLMVVGIFVVVNDPGDAWKALATQAIATAASTLIGLAMMYREIRFRIPTLLSSWLALKVSFSLFLSRASDSLYTSANAFILGLLTSTVQVGFFGVAEKLVRPAISMLWPVANAIYPRISHLIARDKEAAMRLSWIALWATTGLGLLGALLLILLAPLLIHLLAPRFESAIPVLRVMALLLPIVGFGASLSLQFMFPRRLDREVTFSVATAGVINIILALVLAPKLGALGMAIASVVAETWAALVRFVVLKWRRVI